MRLIKDVKCASLDQDLIFFMRESDTIPATAKGWVGADVYLDKMKITQAMSRRCANKVFLYGHERLQIFIMRPAPMVSYDEYKCLGQGSFLFMKNWESFRRFLGQGK